MHSLNLVGTSAVGHSLDAVTFFYFVVYQHIFAASMHIAGQFFMDILKEEGGGLSIKSEMWQALKQKWLDNEGESGAPNIAFSESDKFDYCSVHVTF